MAGKQMGRWENGQDGGRRGNGRDGGETSDGGKRATAESERRHGEEAVVKWAGWQGNRCRARWARWRGNERDGRVGDGVGTSETAVERLDVEDNKDKDGERMRCGRG